MRSITAPEVRRKRTIQMMAAVTVAASLALAGCTAAPTTENDSDVRGDVLTIGTRPPESLNPALLNQVAPLPRLAYDALLVINDDGTFGAGLATDWGYTDDTNQTFELTIRSGIEFSDGDALTATAVADSLNYFIGAGGPSAGLYTGITAVATDDDTVTVTSETPNPDLPTLLTSYYLGGCIISPTGVADPDLLEKESHGVGAYVYSTIEEGAEYTLIANESYYDQDAINFNEVHLLVLGTEAAQTQALLSGQIDVTLSTVSASWSDTVAANEDLTITIGSAAWNGLELLDRQGAVVPALGDVRVRQALMYALDRSAIAAAVYGPDAEARVQPANEAWEGFDASLEDTYGYDPDKALELLEEAGYADGFTIPVAVTAGDVSETLLQAIAGYLDEINVTLEIQSVTNVSALIGALYSGTVVGMALPNSQNSVFQMVKAVFLPTSGLNALQQTDDELVELFEEASLSQDAEPWGDVVEYISENALTIPVASAPDAWISTSKVDLTDAINPSNGKVDILAITPAD